MSFFLLRASIIGLGTDVIDLDRFKKTMATHGQKFLDRLFTEAEQKYCESKPHFRVARYAKRFAAKEAFLKAMGTGRSKGIKWRDVGVSRMPSGQPTLDIKGRALEVLQQKIPHDISGGNPDICFHVSLSDSRDLAMATVIIDLVKEV